MTAMPTMKEDSDLHKKLSILDAFGERLDTLTRHVKEQDKNKIAGLRDDIEAVHRMIAYLLAPKLVFVKD